MTRPVSRYSNIFSTPSHSLLRTPTVRQTPDTYQDNGQSFISTVAISPLPSFIDRNNLFSDHECPKDSIDTRGESAESRQSQRLRIWRHDALLQHQYETAAFIGDKLLARTNDPNDAFWLAQSYYDSGHYARARNLLAKEALLDASVACRCLASQCLIKMELWAEALELLGHDSPFRSIGSKHGIGNDVNSLDGGIRLEASMCYLRGVVFAQLNNFDRAKQCYQEALIIDVKCYDALDALLTNNLMTPDEEWSFLERLSFSGLHSDDIELIRLMYTMRLNKYRSGEVLLRAEEMLRNKYNLGDTPDILLSKGELLFAQSRFADSLEITTKILELDQYKFSALPLHLTCLHELGMKNDLFLLSHDMVDRHPEEPVTWLAVAIYYMSIGKISEARRHFSKASVMNPRFGAAWIGFAHSFASEGEHDQAISAYTTAARLFQGTHLPSLFLGMQHLQLNNVVLADEYLNTAYDMCQTDPLLLNELGVVCFAKQHLSKAVEWFNKALKAAELTENKESAWVATHANLGHAYRKMKVFDKALHHFAQVKRLTPHEATAYAAIGLIELHQGKIESSIASLHQALALSPGDTLANDLLAKALAEAALLDLSNDHISEEDLDLHIDHLLEANGLNEELISEGEEEDMEED